MTSIGRENNSYFLPCKYLSKCQNMFYDSRQKHNNQNNKDKHETYPLKHDDSPFFLLINCRFALRIRKKMPRQEAQNKDQSLLNKKKQTSVFFFLFCNVFIALVDVRDIVLVDAIVNT